MATYQGGNYMSKSILSALLNQDNNFFKLAKSAKRFPHIAFSSLLIPLLFIAVGALIYNLLLVKIIFGDTNNVPALFRDPIELSIIFLLIIFSVWAWVKIVERRKFYTIGLIKDHALKKYLFGFSTGFLMMTAIVGLMALFGSVQLDSGNFTTIEVNTIGLVLLMLFGFIIQGGAEEISTRGWQFQVIGARYKPWIGALVSSLFFALLHGFNNSVSVLAIFNLFLFALLLILFVMNDGSIWSACGWHSAWNWTMGNVLGLDVSGSNVSATLFDLETSGNELITGGGFGPEGSIFTTLVLGIGIFLTAYYILNKIKK